MRNLQLTDIPLVYEEGYYSEGAKDNYCTVEPFLLKRFDWGVVAVYWNWQMIIVMSVLNAMCAFIASWLALVIWHPGMGPFSHWRDTNWTQCLSLSACHQPLPPGPDPLDKTLPKAQRTRGLSSSYQRNILRSHQELKHKSWSNFIFIILTKHQLQNFKQISASRLNLKFKIFTKSRPRFNFMTSTKHQQQNTYQTPALNFAWTSTLK